MKVRLITAISVVCLVALFWSCGDNGTKPEQNDPLKWLKDMIAQTPREDEEAEEAALWVTGAMVAPESTYQQIKANLALIRREFGDSIRELRQIKFTSPFAPREVVIGFDRETVSEIKAGLYHEWDSLNALYKATLVDTSSYFTTLRSVLIDFQGRLNVDSLASCYHKLGGVEWAGGNEISPDRSNIYPWYTGVNWTYLFREGSMDCEAGCLRSRFWYFRQAGSSFEYVGYFDRNWLIWDGTYPDWWSEASRAYNKWFSY